MKSKTTPISLKEFFSIYSQSYGKYKFQVLLIIALGFFSGLLGSIGVSAIIPLFSFVTGDGTPGTDTISTAIHGLFIFAGVGYTLSHIVFFIILLFFSKMVLTLTSIYLNYRAVLQYQEETRMRLMSETLFANWPYLLTQKLGHIETILMKNIEKSTLMLEQTSSAMMIFMTMIAYAIVAFNISSRITVVVFLVAVITFFLLRSFPNRIEHASMRLEALYREIAHYINESVLAMKIIKARGVEDAVVERGHPLVGGITHETLKIRMSTAIPSSMLEPVSVVLVVGIFLFVRNTPGFTIAALAAVVYVIKQIFAYLMQVQTYTLSIRELMPYARVVLSCGEMAHNNKEENTGKESFIFHKQLEFRHVFFAHMNGKEVFKDLSFQVKKGEFVGVIGPSGAGKTTLVDILLRLFTVPKGKIFLDGMEINNISEKTWRSHIGYVPQEVFLLNGTIAENIKFYDKTITDEAIKDAAKLANIYDFIEGLPEKWETQVGERGVLLSGGQKQRIGIAMALARKPEIIIFDEATSALDNESEAQVKQAIENMKGRVTIIAIAHRISSVIDADRIIALGEGKVLEEGKPQELLGRPDSYLSKISAVGIK